MSQIAHCPTCGSQSKIKEIDGAFSYQAVQDAQAFKKISQLKRAMEKFKTKAERLEKELETLKIQ
ncbi:MAG: hypothetical protein ACMVP2_01650 [Imperialibacter sp.]|uniref:hypothetical protein n=1 Tax=Imperialibacter sp. TaxID=2038411 RepID=UPI003A870A02